MNMSGNGLDHGERAMVKTEDGEELEVYDHVSVQTRHYVNSVNGYETFDPLISMGDLGNGPKPEAVTERVADILWSEWMIDVEDHGIEVVDPQDPDVEVY